MKKNSVIEKIIVYVIPFIILMFLVLYFINYANGLRIIGDEYGYWTAGDYLSGRSVWQEFSSWSAYYGFGYGIILGILLQLPFSTPFLYKIAIVINGLMLFGIYCMVFTIIKLNINTKKYYIFKSIFSLAITCITANLYYTQFTMSEVILAFFYWLLCFSLWKYCRTKRLLFIYLACFSSIYMFAIHLRAIGILAVSLSTVLFLLFYNNVKLKRVLQICFFTLMILLAIFIIRKGYLNYLTPTVKYAAKNLLDGNNFNGQTGKIAYFFSAEGFCEFWRLFFGKLFYAFSGTFMLLWPGIIMFIVGVKRIICSKNIRINSEYFMCMISIINLFIAIAIASLYLITGRNSRMDIMTYGRYFEYTIGPAVLFGVLCIKKTACKKNFIRNVLISGATVYLLTAVITNTYQNYNSLTSHFAISSTWMYTWFKKFNFSQGTILYIVLVEMLIIVIFAILYRIIENKNTVALLGLTFIFMYSVYSSFYTYNHGIIPWSSRQEKKEVELYNFIMDNGIENRLYCDISDINMYGAEHLQFLMKDNALHVVRDVEMFIDEYASEYLLTSAIVNEDNLKNRGFNLIISTEKVMLWDYN